MQLERLSLEGVRNLKKQTLQLSPGINHFYGANGAGKTSLLECLYVLGTGKSFRASRISQMVQSHQPYCQITGAIKEGAQAFPTEIQYQSAQTPKFSLNGQPVERISEVAALFPVQILNLDSYQLLSEAPQERRRWIDWMMFHVEHSFHDAWRDYQRCLKQRNASLRMPQAHDQRRYWVRLLANAAQRLHQTYENVLNPLIERLHQELQDFPGVNNLEIEYFPGWDLRFSFEESLEQDLLKDQEVGYTQRGPHRSDLKIKIQNSPAHQRLSMGQQKTWVTGLQMAQVKWMIEQTGKTPLLLIDDLPSEIDRQSQERVAEALSGLNAQFCITSVFKEGFQALQLKKPIKMFHVEHGAVREDLIATSSQ